MSTLSLTLDALDGHAFRPPCAYQLSMYAGPTLGNGRPLALFNHSWSQMEEVFEDVLNKLDEVRKNGMEPTPAKYMHGIDALIKSYTDLIYRASEFISLIIDNMKLSLVNREESIKIKIESAKKFRRHVDIICNKLKHEQNRMGFVGIKYKYAFVPAFSVLRFDSNGALVPNFDIHSRQESFSFLVDIKQIFGDIYFVSSVAAKIFENLDFERKNQVDIKKDYGKITGIITKISNLPLLCVPDQDNRNLTDIKFDGKTLIIERGKIAPFPTGRLERFVGIFSGDG